MKLSIHSTRAEVATWLRQHNFDPLVLAKYDGRSLLACDLCSFVEIYGIRVALQLNCLLDKVCPHSGNIYVSI